MKIIDICGNLCSGKTTLSKLLADNLDFKYIHADLDTSLINSFFCDISKYFLQQQLSFLLNKAMKIHSCICSNKSMVIDRSIFEDINIFASYFIENKDQFNINPDDIDAYQYVAKKILSNLPTTDIAIYCNTSTNTCNKRLQMRRPCSYENLYPQNHIENLYEVYEKKIRSINCGILLEFNGDIYDLHDINTQKDIIREVTSILNGEFDYKQSIKTHHFTSIKYGGK